TRGAAARRAGRTRIPRAHPPPSACSTSCSDADVVRRQRRLALGVLLAAAALAVAAFPFRATSWGGFLLAVAEAGVVGGLADWFAVTPIFRRPLGLPIPPRALTAAAASVVVARVRALRGAQPAARTRAAGLRIGRDNGWDGRVVQAIVLALADALERPAVRATVAEVIDELLTRYRARMGVY